MARAATTADAFNAVAEPRRRQILDVLAAGERSVNDLVVELGLAQPQVSKHLRVLREVGAVAVREEGRRRLYRLNGAALKPIHDWVKSYEQLWSDRFAELDCSPRRTRMRRDDAHDEHEERNPDAPDRRADPGDPRVRRPASPRVAGLDGARPRPPLVAREARRGDRVRDRPSSWREVAVRHGHARRIRGRLPRRVSGDRPGRAARHHRGRTKGCRRACRKRRARP